MKTLIATLLLIPFIGFTQYDSSPQFGTFMNAGLRDYTYNYGKIKSRYGFDAGLNVKHSTRNGVLRMVYAVGLSYDYYKREEITVSRQSIIEDKVKGINVVFRPEFRIMNKERVSMYIGVGPRFSGFYSFMQKRVVTENGITKVENWQRRGTDEVVYFGIHGAISIDYKFAEHWALNLGLNAFTGFEFDFYDGDIFSGGNVTTGIAYVF